MESFGQRSTEKLQYPKRRLPLPRAHSLLCPSPGSPSAKRFIIHKLIAFVLGFGCKIVALYHEDVICFLLALESVSGALTQMVHSEYRAECSALECKARDRQSSPRQRLSRQVPALSPRDRFTCCLSQCWRFYVWRTVWFHNISATFLFHNYLSWARKGLVVVHDVLDIQGKLPALMWGQSCQEDQRQPVRHVKK